jgi:hypothetical protein
MDETWIGGLKYLQEEWDHISLYEVEVGMASVPVVLYKSAMLAVPTRLSGVRNQDPGLQ